MTGTSPNQYLIRCRIIKAKELLLQGFSVESVCMMTGYNSLPHFSRSFKSQTGISPKNIN
ncbi:helix-turn-helix transcriptional regulator [Blautia sp. RD014234]|nr:helix-turn-helix transcriptional regulator [Blautia parvula]